MLKWHDGPYDPDSIGRAEITASLGKMAQRRMFGRAAYLRSVGRQN